MLLTPHTIVGVTIGTLVPDPIFSGPLSFGMHFIGDLVPHWDYSIQNADGTKNSLYPMKVMADMALGIGIGMFFTLRALWVLHDPAMAISIFVSGIAAVLPDAITGGYLFDSEVKGLPRLMFKIQSVIHSKAPLPWGLLSQILVAGVCLLMILNLKAR
jgi:hypothetical protein